MNEKLYEKLCDILYEMERKEKLSASDIQIIDWVTHAKKSMKAIEEMEGGEYSGRSSYAQRSYNRSNRGGTSSRGQSRENRYSEDGSYRGGTSRYSRDGKDEYIEQLYEMLESAPDDKTRQSVQRMIREMEQA